MPTAMELSRRVCGEVFAAREVVEVDQWADRYRRVPAKNSVLGGAWNTDLTPYLRRPMRCYTHAAIREITLMFASQLGKTEAIENMKGYTIDMDPANCLVMFGNVETAKNFNEDRFLPSVMLSERLRRHLLPSAHDVKNGKINFDNLTMYFFGSNSKAGRRGNPIPRLFEDELDSYEDPDVVEVDERVKGGDGTHKIVKTSTPSDEGVGIDEAFNNGSKERFHVPCVHCLRHQVLVFKHATGGLRWDGGGNASPDEAAATARYVCTFRDCGGAMYNFHKPQMLALGLWVPPTRTIVDVQEHGEGSVAGTGAGNRTGIERSHVSFQLSSLYSPFKSASFGEMAKKFVQRRGIMTRDYVRGWVGEPWRIPGDNVEQKELSRLCVAVKDGGYRLGEVVDGVLAIFRGMDVQGDRVYVIDRGFGERGIDTWLVNVLMIPRKEGMRLSDVWASLPSAYRRVGKKDVLKVRAEFIDSGAFTDEIYQAVVDRRRMGIMAWPVKGRQLAGTSQRYQANPIDKSFEGKPLKGMPRLLTVNSDLWKTSLVGRIRGSASLEDVVGSEQEYAEAQRSRGGAEKTEGSVEGEDGAGGGAGVVPGYYLPEFDEDGRMAMYIEQVTSEHKVADRGRDGHGRPKYSWKLRPGRGQNHLFDAECYAMCGADFAGIRRFVGTVEGGGGKK